MTAGLVIIGVAASRTRGPMTVCRVPIAVVGFSAVTAVRCNTMLSGKRTATQQGGRLAEWESISSRWSDPGTVGGI